MDAKTKGIVMTYLGYEVFDRAQLIENMNNDIKNNFSWIGSEAKKQVKNALSYTEAEFKRTYLCHSLAEARELRDFFRNKAGRLTPFWLPSFKNDVLFAQNAAAGDTEVLFVNAQRKYALQSAKRHIYIRKQQWAAKITGITMFGVYEFGDETITLSQPLPVDVDTKSPPCIENLYLVRLNSDEYRLEKYGAKFFTVTFGFKELQGETP
jgi:hypothetical protein